MALTRPMLKGMNLTEEQVTAIIDAHMESVDALKKQRDTYKEAAEKLPGVQKELDDLKNGKDWKSEADKIRKEFDDFKASAEAKETESAKREALREIAKSAGLSDAGIGKAVKYTDLSTVELDKDGKVKNADKLTESLKAEWGDYVATTQTRGAHVGNPPAKSGNTTTKADIYKKDDKGRYVMSTAERQKALAEMMTKQ